MSQSLDNLTAEVAQVKTVAASAVALIQGFQSRLDAAIAAAKAGDNSAALDQLSADLKASVDPLAAAVSANTPAALPVILPGGTAGNPSSGTPTP